MASSTVEHGTANNVALDPRKYKALNDLLGTSDFNKPDVRDLLVKTYGDQGITGFLQLTGAVNSGGSADQVEWFEEGRRHKLYKATTGDTLSSGASTSTMVFEENPSKYDVLMHVGSGIKVIVTSDQAAVHCYI